MPFVYVSKKADGFPDPVYHCDRNCGSVEFLDENDTLKREWVRQRRTRILVGEFVKRLRQCCNCC